MRHSSPFPSSHSRSVLARLDHSRVGEPVPPDQKTKSGTAFTADQRTCLELMRDHIATSQSLEPDDFDYSPFSLRGGLGKAHQLFGAQLPSLLEELNQTLVA